MKRRTRILADLIEAGQKLDEAQVALTRAYVALEERTGDEARDARVAVKTARDQAYAPELGDLIEGAITAAGKLV